MDVIVRPITPSLAARWLAMRCQLWPDGTEEHSGEIAAFFEGSAIEPLAVLSAHDASGEMIGFAELSIRSDIPGLEEKRTGYVEGLYVTPAQRNQGVARRLLQSARDWAREQDCQAFASNRTDRIVVDSSF
jgi:aminoglycoside 6'-N-acetyltransferase I